jgi:hypothetical protein
MGNATKSLEVRVQITELSTLVEKKDGLKRHTQTDVNMYPLITYLSNYMFALVLYFITLS